MKNFKLKATVQEICDQKCILEFTKEAHSYTFDEKPNYKKLIFLLTKELFKINVLPDKHYTWIASNKFFYGILPLSDED